MKKFFSFFSGIGDCRCRTKESRFAIDFFLCFVCFLILRFFEQKKLEKSYLVSRFKVVWDSSEKCGKIFSIRSPWRYFNAVTELRNNPDLFVIHCSMQIKSRINKSHSRGASSSRVFFHFPQLNNSIIHSKHAWKEISWRKSKSNYDMQVEQTTSLSCFKCLLYWKRCSQVHWDVDVEFFFKHALGWSTCRILFLPFLLCRLEK